jgi:hypothetical protein
LREKAKDKNNKIITQSYAKKRKDTQRFLWVGTGRGKAKDKSVSPLRALKEDGRLKIEDGRQKMEKAKNI